MTQVPTRGLLEGPAERGQLRQRERGRFGNFLDVQSQMGGRWLGHRRAALAGEA